MPVSSTPPRGSPARLSSHIQPRRAAAPKMRRPISGTPATAREQRRPNATPEQRVREALDERCTRSNAQTAASEMMPSTAPDRRRPLNNARSAALDQHRPISSARTAALEWHPNSAQEAASSVREATLEERRDSRPRGTERGALGPHKRRTARKGAKERGGGQGARASERAKRPHFGKSA